MKVLFLGNTSPSLDKTYSWFIRTMHQGLSLLGHETCGIMLKNNTPANIKQSILSIKPDIVLTHMILRGHIIPTETMLNIFSDCRKKGIKFVHTMQDAKLDPEYSKSIKGAFDFSLIGHRHNLEKLRSIWQVPVCYFPQSSMTYKEMSPRNPKYDYKYPIFLGSPNTHKDRKEFIMKLKKVIKFKIIETKSPQDIRNNTWEFAASARCILGLCTGYNIEGYSDARIWQYLGAGAFIIQRKFLGLEEVIPDNLYAPFFGYSNKDAEYVKELVTKHITVYNKSMRLAAFKYMQENHSSIIRAKNTINYLIEKQEYIVPGFGGV